jgi:thiamine biosynthesis lipoprotein
MRFRSVDHRSRSCLFIALAFTAVAGCDDRGGNSEPLRGQTMGTQYQVQTACASPPSDLAAEMTVLLDDIEVQMSTYRHDSLLSRLNRAPSGEWLQASSELLDVLEPAQTLSELSGGAFDVTVGPLVNLWGFGPVDAPDAIPSASDIAAARNRVGYQHLELRRPAQLRKQRELYIDLSAIAKGYAVDRMAQYLLARGCESFLVEIGGEVRVHGRKSGGAAWRIGVESPDPDALGGVLRVIRTEQLEGIAMATSGDYRNFLELGGQRFSHTIDPRTGVPVAHRLASVTVLHGSTLWADGFATLLNVMGPTEGFELAEREHLAALFVERTDTGFVERATSDFARYVSPAVNGH